MMLTPEEDKIARDAMSWAWRELGTYRDILYAKEYSVSDQQYVMVCGMIAVHNHRVDRGE